MKKSTKIAVFTSSAAAAAGAALGGLYKLADYFFKFCLVRADTRYKDSQKPVKQLSAAQKAALDFKENRKLWLNNRELIHLKTKAADGLNLHADFLPSETNTQNFILAIHGYRCSGPEEYAVFAPFYHGMGFNLIIPDDRAHGRSEGEYIGFGCLDRQDCLTWCEYIIKNFGSGCRIFLHGISMGSATVLSASGDQRLPSQVKGIISDCGFSRGWDELKYILKLNYRLPAFPLLNIFDFLCRHRAGYSTKDFSPLEQVAHAKVPILFIHGGQDKFVPTAMVYALYDACASDKMLRVFKGAAHAQSYYTDTDGYEKIVREFIKRVMKKSAA